LFFISFVPGGVAGGNSTDADVVNVVAIIAATAVYI